MNRFNQAIVPPRPSNETRRAQNAGIPTPQVWETLDEWADDGVALVRQVLAQLEEELAVEERFLAQARKAVSMAVM